MRYQLAATLLLFACSAFGQVVAGTAAISGVVRDPSGATVPGAKVVISSAGQGTLRTLTTNAGGAFSAPALTPGPGYKVTVTAPGFNTYEADQLVLAVGQDLALNIPLAVGSSVTQVEVSGTATMVEDTKSDVSIAVDSRAIQDLPINGRRVDSFVLLTPGVTNDATFGLLSFRGVAGNNSFLVDGNDNTEQFYDENAGRTRIQSQISQDAVQEFQVVSTDYSAEYGRAMGGVVNTVTKSGTNDLHGSGFYFFRSTGFDARDPFASFNPSERRVEGGASVGGPIKKDKLFYFVNFDLTHRNFPMVDSYVQSGVVNPTTQTWIGCGVASGTTPAATPAQCNAINALLPRFYGQIPRTGDNDLAFGKLDYHINEKNTLTAEFNFLRWWSPNGIQTGLSSTSGAGITGNGDDSVRVRNGKLGWTFVPSSSLVNNFRFGWDTDRQADSFDQAELGSGLGYLDVSVGGVQLGPATYLPRVEPSETRYEFSDDLSKVHGAHSFKFGFNYFTTEDYNYFISNAFGSYTYLNPNAFALDYTGNTTGAKNWSSYSQTFGNPVADYRINELAWYALDQWKATPKLTVNLGVRYDKSMSMNFPVVNPDWPGTGYIHTPSANFSPRIGLAYRLNDKTTLRAGYGMFYARLLGGLIDNLWTTNGQYQISASLSSTNSTQLAAGPVFPNALPTAPVGAGSTAIQFAAPDLRTPYSSQANVTVERQLSSDFLLSVSGIFSRGIHLLSSVDVNAPYPSGSFTYTIADANGNPTGSFTTPIYQNPRPNTHYGTVIEDTNGIDSVYSALAVSLTKRFSHGIQMLASYTWAHEIDDGQGGGSSAIFYSGQFNTYNGNNAFERGSGTLDQRHRFVYSFVWQPTVTHSQSALAKYLLNSWQLSAITTLAAGRPAGSPSIRVSTPIGPSTPGFPGTQGLLSTTYIDGLVGSTRVPWLPVNSIYTWPSYRADARISKLIPIAVKDRTLNLYLNFEAFNVSNSWAPTSMATQQYAETKAGVLQATPTAWGYPTADGGFPDGTQARRLQVSLRLTF
ncbi:MAG TPA: TonB-dependent receptor [Bryobacteraceae bacterium]|nr:TonB-dependent receptor [Bryobacteraceae bacterium]